METKTPDTSKQFDAVIAKCREIFLKKAADYGTAWRILRPESVTDQIFIKAQRIRTIQEKKTQKVDDGIEGEFIGILNYSIMALIQIELKGNNNMNLFMDDTISLYNKWVNNTKQLMFNKNHDYGEAWRNMRISSFVDLILMKLLRTKQIEEHDGKTLISENVDANYQDIINYSVFALIKLEEAKI